MEAFAAAAESGYPIEFDLRALKDGTLVPLHDRTVDRTMTGVSGTPETITAKAWEKASIRPAASGKPGTPTTWDKIMQAHAQDNILVPELKDPNIDVEKFADSIHSYGIKENVVVQTFDYSTARKLAANGLKTLYLTTESTEMDPEVVVADGIEYIGPSKATSADKISAMKDAGLRVWAWTVNDPAAAVALFETGIHGVFTDDPWAMSDYLETVGR